MNKQQFICRLNEIKFDASPDGAAQQTRIFSGYGAAFNNIDAYGDVIMPGAFADFLADARSGSQPWPSMLSQHGGWQISAEDMTPVGVWQDLSEDGAGRRADLSLIHLPEPTRPY